MSDPQDRKPDMTETQAIKKIDKLEESQIQMNNSHIELQGKYKGLRTLAEKTDKTVSSIHDAIQGDPMNGVKGMAQRLIDVEEALPENGEQRLKDLEAPQKAKKRVLWAILLAVASGIGGLIFAKATGKI